MRDCRTCKHNSYLYAIAIRGWFNCTHPITLRKGPDWEEGDPAMVNFRTADVPMEKIRDFQNCPTWELKELPTPNTTP